MNEPIGILIVGNDPTHVDAVARQPRARLVGVADQSAEDARAAAALLGCERWSTDVKSALAWPGVDACLIDRVDSQYEEIAEAASAAGKHTLALNPPTATANLHRRVHRRFAESGLILLDAPVRRMHDDAATVRSLAESGSLGRVVFVRLTSLSGSEARSGPDETGIESLRVEELDLAAWWVDDDPMSLFTRRGGTADSYECITLSFTGGATAICEIGTRAGPVGYREAFVVGTQGSVTVSPSDDPVLLLPNRIPPSGVGRQERARQRAVETWLDAITSGADTRVGPPRHVGVALAEAAAQSGRSGQVVPAHPGTT